MMESSIDPKTLDLRSIPRRWLASLREYWTLADATASLARQDAGARGAASRELRLGWQARDAAEVLMLDGSTAEAIGTGLRSAAHIETALEALPDLARDPRSGEHRDIGLVRAFVDVARGGPDLDSGVTPAQLNALATAIRAEQRLERRLSSRVLDASGLARQRLANRARVVATLAVAVAVVVFAWKVARTTRIEASGSLTGTHGPENAIDGDPNTDWVAPPGEAWIEISYPHKRRLDHIRVIDGHVVVDRAAKDIRVNLYDHQRAVGTFEGSFGPQGRLPPVLTFDPAGVLADRLRVTIKNVYGPSGALAEILVD